MRGRCGETHPRQGGVYSADFWKSKIPQKHSPEGECFFYLRTHVIPTTTDHCRVKEEVLTWTSIREFHLQRLTTMSESCQLCHAGIAQIPDEIPNKEIIVLI